MRASLLAGIAFSAGAILLPSAGRAAPPETLTQALVEAYNNNATLQEQRASLRATDEDVPTALSGWRPTVAFTGSAGRITGNETEQVEEPSDHGFGADVPTSVKLPESRTEAIGQIQLTQPIYSGGKVVAATRQAKNSVYAARAQLLATEQTVFLNVVNAYVTVITDTAGAGARPEQPGGARTAAGGHERPVQCRRNHPDLGGAGPGLARPGEGAGRDRLWQSADRAERISASWSANIRAAI